MAVALAVAAVPCASASAASTAYSWGRNAHGEAGDGTTVMAPIPAAIGLSEVNAIAGGETFALALLAEGNVEAWGGNDHGELGDGNTTSSRVPVPVSGLSEVSAIAAGGRHGLALLSNGTVEAWGENASGQLGDGNTTGSDVPVPVSGLSEVTAIAAGSATSYALLSNGTVMAWGENASGQLGDGAEGGQSDTPVEVRGSSEVTAIAAGNYDGYALLRSGTAEAWGDNLYGQLGDGREAGSEPPERDSDVPVAVSGLSEVSAIAAGGTQALALLANGTAEAWGNDQFGQLGNDKSGDRGETEIPESSDVPVPVDELSEATEIAAGGEHSFALLADGTVMAWGGDEHGELGDGRHGEEHGGAIRSAVPIPVSCGLTGVRGIAASTWAGYAFGEISGYDCPTVSEVSPSEGSPPGGTTVTIKGTGFEGATAVDFGETPAESFVVESPTEIKAVSPHHSGGRPTVKVTTPAGTNDPSPGDFFTFAAPVEVSSVFPAYGPAAGGTRVRIEGHGLEDVTAVYFGSTPSTYWDTGSGDYTEATAPPGSGIDDVTVVTRYAGSSEVNPEATFDYLSGPEFGRCGKYTNESGRFRSANCTELTSPGSDEWYPAFLGEYPLQKRGLTLSASAVELETASRQQITCARAAATGEYTNGASLALVLHLLECIFSEKHGEQQCTSEGATAGEVRLVPLTGELGVTKASAKPSKERVGLQLAPASGETLARFACGTTAVTLRGSVIAEAKTKNEMSTTLTLASKGKRGADGLTRFVGGPEAKPQIDLGNGYEGVGVTLAATVTSEEAVELNTLI